MAAKIDAGPIHVNVHTAFMTFAVAQRRVDDAVPWTVRSLGRDPRRGEDMAGLTLLSPPNSVRGRWATGGGVDWHAPRPEIAGVPQSHRLATGGRNRSRIVGRPEDRETTEGA